MKIFLRIIPILLFSVFINSKITAQLSTKERDEQAIERAQKGWWAKSMETRDERIAWWDEAKFGMFVHWGVYSVPAGVWKGDSIGQRYSEHLMRIKQIPVKEYREKVAASFNPVNFNADEWIKLAKDAGMKYFVITAKHHDGFAMYDSDVSPYNIVDASEFNRDPMIELKQACKKYGIKFGFYYSHAFDWDHPDAPGNDWDYVNPGGGKNLFGGRRYYDHSPEQVERMAKYVNEKSIPQVQELLRKYEPDIMWFDTPHKLAFFENLRILEELRKIAPDVVVNGRLAGNFGDYSNTCDKPLEFFPTNTKYWEAIPTTNESYGYNVSDNSHKPASHFIQLLAKSASRGGNLLMNLGPKGNGEIDKIDSDILKGIGSWLSKNGESIYGTDKTSLPKQIWGVTTQKEENLYLHVFNYPKNGKLILGGLKSKFGKVYLLDGNKKLNAKRINSTDVEISLPKSAPDEVSTVIVLKLEEPVEPGNDCLLTSDYNNRLMAFDAELNGEELKYGRGTKNDYYVYDWVNSTQNLTWNIRLKEDTVFDVIIKYQTSEKSGGTFTVNVN
ncbi:MAG: alpha-L-fucosidase, partial [Draconibacterium sp.]|nr:alpha-L-fucosidase [Draconibacterium sp.]